MNILFIASDNRRESGAFRSMVQLASLLKNTCKHNILIVIPRKGNGVEMLKDSGLEYVYVPSGDWTVHIKDQKTLIQITKHIVKLMINIFAVPRLKKIILERKIDIVHINTSWTYVGAKAAMAASVPFIWHLREFLEEDQERKIWNREYGYSLMGKADQLVAISNSIYKKYVRIFGDGKVTQIYNGINPDVYADLSHVPFQKAVLNFIIVGNVSEGKRQLDAVMACITLRSKGIDNFDLKIVGNNETEYADRIKRVIIENDASDYISMVGKTKTPELFYKDADVTFMCSEAEAFGRVTVEAMMAGSLVIGANSAGTKELIVDNVTGLMYEAGNVDALINKIEYALSHSQEMRTLARNGQKYMLENMTAEKNAENVNDLYKRIIG